MANKIGCQALVAQPLQDSSFTEVLLSMPSYGIFYGSDSQNNHENYFQALKKALDERIKTPILKWCKNPRDCFFKPYSGIQEGFNGFQYGLLTPLLAILSGLGFLGILASHPAAIIALFCAPALMEFFAAFVGLGQAMGHQLKAWYYHSEAEHEEAYAYFLDAMTRLALVIPLAVVSLVLAPFEVIRFVTRSMATLIDYFTASSGPSEATDNRI